MLTLPFIFVLAGITICFLGYWTHQWFHHPSSGWLYRAHQNHHFIQYPPHAYLSDTYKSAGTDSTRILFAIVFSPLIIGLSVLTFFGVLSLWHGIAALLSLGLWGYVHDYVHDQFHLSNTWLLKLPGSWFTNWRRIHYIHHLDQTKNFGIVYFGWDKWFGTFEDETTLEIK